MLELSWEIGEKTGDIDHLENSDSYRTKIFTLQ